VVPFSFGSFSFGQAKENEQYSLKPQIVIKLHDFEVCIQNHLDKKASSIDSN